MTDPACPVCSGRLTGCVTADFNRGFSHTCTACRTLITIDAFDDLVRTEPWKDLQDAVQRLAVAVVDEVASRPRLYVGGLAAVWFALAVCALASIVLEMTA